MAAPDFVASNLYVETIAPLRKERRAVSMEVVKSMMVFVETAADFAVCMAGLLAAYTLGELVSAGSIAQHSALHVVPLSAAFALVVVFLLHRDGTYQRDSGLMQIRETERALRASAQALLLFFVIGFLLGIGDSLLASAIALVVVPALMILEKQILFSIANRLRRNHKTSERVVVYGSEDAGRHVVSTLLHSPRLALHPVAVIGNSHLPAQRTIAEMGYRGRMQIPVHSGPLTPALLKSLRCDLLLLATFDISADEIAAAREAAEQVGANVALLRGPETGSQQSANAMELDGLVFSTSAVRPMSWIYPLTKRVVDLVVSSALLILLAPILVLIAILVRLDSPGPALFVQKRVGQGGERFDMFKFRSMHDGAPRYAPSPTSSSDPRITRIGRYLRRASLDELPQLVNVLMGTMSLVGPRPEMPFIVEGYDARQRQRLQVTPGITGLWQLSADRAYPIHENAAYDLYYIRNRNLSLDLSILIHTLFFAVRGGI